LGGNVTSWAQFRHSKRAGIFLALLLLVVDTRECNIDLVLLNGTKEGQSVGFLQDVKLLR
jgi:hypothetical protein